MNNYIILLTKFIHIYNRLCYNKKVKKNHAGWHGGCMLPSWGLWVSFQLDHSRKGVLWMEFVLMIIVVIAIVIYPKQGTFIEKVKFKGSFKSFEIEISTKQKNCPPTKKDSSST